MSLGMRPAFQRFTGFPRVSGDEPRSPIKENRIMEFSPRERG